MSTATVAPKITIRKATKTLNNENLADYNNRKKRVAAYARVSTDEEDQATSYTLQVTYYRDYIKDNPEWEFVDVYADEGITGTSIVKRDGFKQMIADAKAGKIDIIITKSISRFARNTVDTLMNIRELRDLGVEVIFEKENIHTMDKTCELMLTMFSSLAQEESRSISENIRWSQEKRRQEGKVNMAYGQFLGYKKGEDGNPEIIDEEAAIVREIYDLFIMGHSQRSIKDILESKGYLTPRKKKIWNVATIQRILENEKYKGDALLQKTFTKDFLDKKRKKNTGQRDSIYVENSHPAIVDEETYDLVQYLIKHQEKTWRSNMKDPFFNKVFCGECGQRVGKRTWGLHNGVSYSLWCCTNKYGAKKIDTRCKTPNVSEDVLKDGFVSTFNQIIGNRNAIMKATAIQIKETEAEIVAADYDGKIEKTKNNAIKLKEKVDNLETEFQRSGIYPDDYEKTINDLVKKLEKAKQKLADLADQKLEHKVKRIKLSRFLKQLEKINYLLDDFDYCTWMETIDRIIISEDKLTYRYIGGTELSINLNDMIASIA